MAKTAKQIEYMRQWRKKRDADPAKREAWLAYLRARDQHVRHTQSYKEARRRRESVWVKANRPWVSFKNRLKKYHITLDQFHSKLESQDFVCAICGTEAPLVIDHDHLSNRVRGLLCASCNIGIGHLREQHFDSARIYMSKWI